MPEILLIYEFIFKHNSKIIGQLQKGSRMINSYVANKVASYCENLKNLDSQKK